MVNQLFNESTWQYYMHCPVCINALYTARTTEVCATYSVDNITLQIGHYIKFHKYVPCEHYITKRRIIKDRLTAVKLSFKDNRFQGISYNMVVKVGTFGKFSFEPLLSGRRTLYTVPLLQCFSFTVYAQNKICCTVKLIFCPIYMQHNSTMSASVHEF